MLRHLLMTCAMLLLANSWDLSAVLPLPATWLWFLKTQPDTCSKCECSKDEPSTLPGTCGDPQQYKFMKYMECKLTEKCDFVDPVACRRKQATPDTVLKGHLEASMKEAGEEELAQVIKNGNVDDDGIPFITVVVGGGWAKRSYGHNYNSSSGVMEADFVVVGAGTAGSVVAARLSEIPYFDIVLLEAGGPEPAACQIPSMYLNYQKNNPYNWHFALEPQQGACLGYPGGRCFWPRGKSMGGTSVLHGMMYMRGNPWDYNNLQSMGISGWNFSEVLPYFLKGENNTEIGTVAEAHYHQTGGYLTVQRFRHQPEMAHVIMAAAREVGCDTHRDLNGEKQLGFAIAQATTRDGSRLSLSRAYIQPLLDKKNLHVHVHSMVTKILIDKETKQAIGVEYERDGKRRRVMAKKEVILCAGTIQSPQILMLSGIGSKEHLQDMGIEVVHNQPRVGKNLINHVSFSVKFSTNHSTEDVQLNHQTFEKYMKTRDGPLSSTGLSQVTGFVRLNVSDKSTPETVPHIQVFFDGYISDCSKNGSVQVKTSNKSYFFHMVPTLLRPLSRGELRLRSSDYREPPLIYANYLTNKEDVDLLIKGIRFCIRLSQTEAMRKEGMELVTTRMMECGDHEVDSDEYWECAIRHFTNPENHQVGTCSMGSGMENSVVDSKLRVHGLSRLRVIDASSFPVVPSGNLNAPVVMLAEKGAAMITHDYTLPP